MLTGMDPFTKSKPKRRWLQFSIRTMLVVVSVSCVALSLWIAPAERKRRAVAAIEALRGEVTYEEKEMASRSFPVAYLRRWLPQVYFDEVKAIALTGPQITDADLAHLEGLTGLQELVLDSTEITDAGLSKLRNVMPNCIIWVHDPSSRDGNSPRSGG